MGALNSGLKIVERSLAKKAAEEAADEAVRKALKATAHPEWVKQLEREDVRISADKASKLYEDISTGAGNTPAEKAAYQRWQDALAKENVARAPELEKQTEAIKKLLDEKNSKLANPGVNGSELSDYEKSRITKIVDSEREYESKLATYNNETELERAGRIRDSKKVSDEGTKVLESGTSALSEHPPIKVEHEVADAVSHPPITIQRSGPERSIASMLPSARTASAAVATGAIMGNQFINPADVVKAGYGKFEQVRQSITNKVVDLTDMTANNPYVPQYAKDTYNKAANAVVNAATDPLNAVGGAGAVDAAIGAGGAAYDMYSSARKPSSTPVDNKPMTNPAQKVNWPR